MTVARDHLRRLMDLAKEPSSEKRRELLDQVTTLFLDEAAPLAPSELDLGVDIVARLAGQMESRVRTRLAERLADAANAPLRLVSELAQDEIEVARPLLTRCDVLGDGDLIALAQKLGQEHLLAMSGRSCVSPALSDAIVARGDDRVLVALVENQGASLSARAMATVVERSETVDALRAPLVERRDLAPDLMHQMLFWVTGALRQRILARGDVDESTLEPLLEEARQRLVIEMQRPEEALSAAERAIRRAQRLNQLNPQFLLAALRQGRRDEFVLGFAMLTELDAKTTRRVIAAPGHEAMAIACKSREFDANTFSSLALLTHPNGAQNVRSGGEFAALVELYRAIPVDAARRAMRFWRIRSGG